jgi:hypothetical protein
MCSRSRNRSPLNWQEAATPISAVAVAYRRSDELALPSKRNLVISATCCP